MVDVSHLSDQAFKDVCDVAERPFVASHSNCRSLCPHPRNLTDEIIRALALRGGVVGISLARSSSPLGTTRLSAQPPGIGTQRCPRGSGPSSRSRRDRRRDGRRARPPLSLIVDHVRWPSTSGAKTASAWAVTSTAWTLARRLRGRPGLSADRGSAAAERLARAPDREGLLRNFLRVFQEVLG